MAASRSIVNTGCLSWDEVPLVDGDTFRRVVAEALRAGERTSAMFVVPTRADGGPTATGNPALGGRLPGPDVQRADGRGGSSVGDDVELALVMVLASDVEGTFRLLRTRLSPEMPSLTAEWPQLNLFERDVVERCGVRFVDHPWPGPVRRIPREDQLYRVDGAEVHGVAVGPVHAGVIEPGHFRFQCHGEEVFFLEIALGFQHRGALRALVGGPTKRSLPVVETIAGDSTVAHATAHAHAIESLAGVRVPVRAQAVRGVGLELERLANHVGTLGALAGDVAFSPTASYCGRLRGEFLNLTASLCGNRFGRGLIRPGGVGFDVEPARAADMRLRLDRAIRDVDQAVTLMLEAPSVQSRFELCGRLGQESAVDLGLVGPAARAVGLERDARHDFAAGIYRYAQVPVSTWPSGDVFARAWVRFREVDRSAEFVRKQLGGLPRGELRAAIGALRPDTVCVSVVEGHRGEVVHVAVTDRDGKFAAYEVVDPSFRNWSGLALALRGQAISDFPLCNKSFDLSYCGFDL